MRCQLGRCTAHLLNQQKIMTPHNTTNASETTRLMNTCTQCGKVSTTAVSTEGYQAWLSGVPIQVALSDLSDGEREMLLSGVCEACFDAMFPDDDDEVT